MDSTLPLGKVYIADEAAARLRMTRRGVITLGRRYGCCSMNGREVLFSEQDLLDIWQIMRAPATSTKPPTTKAVAFYSTDDLLRRIVWQKQQEHDERARRRKERLAEDREAKRKRDAEKREARLAEKRRVAEEKRKAKTAKALAGQAAKAELLGALDRKSRDPAYWTDERKEALRHERLARLRSAADE